MNRSWLRQLARRWFRRKKNPSINRKFESAQRSAAAFLEQPGISRPIRGRRPSAFTVFRPNLECLEHRIAPAVFSDGGTATLTIDLAANEQLGIVSNGTEYVFTTNQTFTASSGTDPADQGTRFSAFGLNTITLMADGLAAYDNVAIVDSGSLASVSFDDSGANAYSDNFTVTLDNGAASPALTFAGATSFTGANGLTANVDTNISFVSSSSLSTVNGNLDLRANANGTATGNFVGISLNDATIASSGTGFIRLEAQGGDDAGTGGHFGIRVTNGSVIESTSSAADAGSVTLIGTGGTGSGTNHGVFIVGAGSRVTSDSGNIDIDGTASSTATGSFNIGVLLHSGGQVTSAGIGGNAATIDIDGIGGSGANDNFGLNIDGTSSLVSSVDGNIVITGAATDTVGGNQDGVRLEDGGQINTSGTATLMVTGTAGNDISSGINLATNDNSMSLTGASNTFIADSINFQTGSTINAGSNAVTFRQNTANTAINLGGADAAGTLGLSDSELDIVTAGTINIGNTDTGNVTVSDTIDRTAATNLIVTTNSANSIDFNTGGSLVAGLTADVTLNTGTVTAADANADVTANSLSVAAGNGIGASGNPLRTAVNTLISDSSANNGNQFLSEADSLSIGPAGLGAGTGTIQFVNGTFNLGGSERIDNASGVTVSSPAVFDLNGFSETIDSLNGDGTIRNSGGGGVTLTFGSDNGGGDFSGLIEDGTATVALTKAGSGQQTLSGNNTYTGVTNINAGQLVISHANALGATTGATSVNGGSLELANTITVAENITLNGGALRNRSENNIVTGNITLTDNSEIAVDSANSFEIQGDIDVGTFQLTFRQTSSTTGNPTPTQVVSGAITGTGSVTQLGDIGDNTGTLRYTGSLANTYSGLTAVGHGILELNKPAATDAIAGNLAVGDGTGAGNGAATVILTNTNQIADGSFVSVNDDGTFDLNDHSETIAQLTGAGNVFFGVTAGNTLTVGDGNDFTFSGVISESGNLSKTGVGTFTLSGNNTYDGTTTVTTGTLALSHSSNNNIASSPTIDVDAGAFLDVTGLNSGRIDLASDQTLMGDGTVTGAVTALSNSTIAPGSSPGTLSAGNTTFDSGSNFDVEINGTASGQFDVLDVTGVAELDGNINLSGSHVPASGDPVLSVLQATAVTGNFSNAPDGATLLLNDQPLEINYTSTTVQLAFDPTPIINAGAGNNNIILRRDAGGSIEVEIDGQVVLDTPATDLNSLIINGDDGNDSLLIDFTNGNPIPAGGFEFHGGVGGDDAMGIRGTGTQNTIYTPDAVTPGDGRVTVNGTTITFTGLEPIDFDNVDTFTLDLPGDDDVVDIAEGFNSAVTGAAEAPGTVPALVFTGTSGGVAFESAHVFRTTNVIVDTNINADGNDTITITSANNAHANTNLTIDTGTGADTLDVNGIVSFSTGTIDIQVTDVDLNADLNAATVTGTADTIDVESDAAQIQDAISIANPNATINVAAGTYDVTSSLDVDKALTLQGSSAATTTVLVDGTGVNIIADDVLVDGFTFTTGGATTTGIGLMRVGVSSTNTTHVVDNVTISNNIFENFETSQSTEHHHGVAVGPLNVTNVTISDNIFRNLTSTAVGDVPGAGISGVVVFNTAGATPQGISITGNTFEDITQANGGAGLVVDGAISIQGGAAGAGNGILVSNNTISNISGADVSTGVIVHGTGVGQPSVNVDIQNNNINNAGFAGILTGAGVTDVSVTENIIHNNTRGVWLLDTADQIVVNRNDLSLNTTGAVNDDPDDTLDASANWWGSNVEGTVAGLTSGLVDFTPFLNVGTDVGGDPSNGFQGDFSTLIVTAMGAQIGGGRIQEGVGLVDDSSGTGRLEVRSGTYPDNVDSSAATGIDKDVTFAAGSSPGLVTVTGSFTLDSNDTLEVEVNGVTTAGTDYDQWDVDGTVDLGNATLNAIGTVTGTSLGDTVTIIDNDGTADGNGTFGNFAQGDVVTINGQDFRIFYDGGDGNDVVLVATGTTTGNGLVAEVYVNEDWAGTTPGADPDGGTNPATAFGVDAFATIQEAIDHVIADGTGIIYVLANGADGPQSNHYGAFNLDIEVEMRFIEDYQFTGDTTVTLGGAITLSANADWVLFDDVIFNPADLATTSSGTIDADTATVLRNLQIISSTNGAGGVSLAGNVGVAQILNNITIGSNGVTNNRVESIALNNIVSGATVSLNTTGGISETTADGTADISAVSLVASAGTTIDIDTNVSDIEAHVTAAGGIDIDEANAVTLSDVDTTDGTITISAGGAITATNVEAGGSGNVDLSTTAGNIGVGIVSAAGDRVTLNAASAITDGNAATNNISALEAVLIAPNGIGTSGDPLETTVSNLDFNNATSGGVFVTNSGDLTLTDLNAQPATAQGGTIIAASSHTISMSMTINGSMTFTADNSTNNDDNLTIDNNVVLTLDSNTPLTLTLNAGDDVVFDTGRVTTTGTGPFTVAINADEEGAGGDTNRGSVTQTDTVTTSVAGVDRLDIQAADGVGALGTPFRFSAATLDVDTSGNNGDQFLSQSTSTTVDKLLSGSGTIHLVNGEYNLDDADDISDTSPVVVAAGATLDLQANNETIGSLAGDGIVNLGSGTLTTGGNGDSTTFDGVIADVMASGLTKVGAGTFTLTSNAHSYTGTTTIDAGTLLVNGVIISPVIVSGGTLGGTGTVDNTVTMDADGGSIAPGVSPGILTVDEDVTFNAAGSFDVEINGAIPGVTHDQLRVTGAGRSVSLNNAELNVSLGFTPAPGNSFIIIHNVDPTSTVSGVFNFGGSALNEGDTFTVAIHTFTITYQGGDGNDVELRLSPNIEFVSANFDDSEGVGTSMAVTLLRTGDVGLSSEVQVSITGGTATGGGTDYSDAGFPMTITFAAGESLKRIPVPIVDDNIVEPDETINFEVTALTNSRIGAQDTATLEITNNDTASLSIDDVSVDEADGTATFTITSTNPSSEDLTVRVDTANGSATEGDDFAGVHQDFTIPGDQTSTTVTVVVPITNDSIAEITETYFINLSNARFNGVDDATRVVIGDSQGEGEIIDNDDATLAINDVTMAEANSGFTQFQFTVTLTGDVDHEVRVDFATADDTATVADGDYVSNSGTVIFDANGGATQTETITVNVQGDMKVEPDELFFVNLSNIQAGGRDVTFTDDQAVGGITNDDTANLSVDDISVAEDGSFMFTITSDKEASEDLTVQVDTSVGTATSGVDFAAIIAQTVTISAGDTSTTIVVTVTDDNIVEPDETFFLDLSNAQFGGSSDATRVVIADAQGQATIENNDKANLSIDDVSVDEAAGIATFTITSTNPSSEDLTVAVDTASGSATEGADFTGVHADFIISGDGTSTTVTVDVPITNDGIAELTENYVVNLSNARFGGLPDSTRVMITDSQGEGEITDNDQATISITGVTMDEGDGSFTQFVFDVTLTGEVDSQVFVEYTTQDGSAATADGDYTSENGTVFFNANGGATQTRTITVNVFGDTKVELDEAFDVVLSNIQANGRDVVFAGAGNTETATGNITNDDDATISIDDVTMNEGDSGVTSFTFDVTLDAEVDAAITLEYDTQDGSATTADNDYTSESDMLTFAANSGGPQTLQITIDVQGDEKIELDEAFQVILSNLQDAGRDVTFDSGTATETATGNILNDDSATISINDVTMDEGDSGVTTYTFTVTLDAEIDALVSVDYTIVDSTATAADNDFVANSDTLTFAANTGGPQTRQITVDVNGDEKVELDEQFFVDLFNLQAAGRAVTLADDRGEGTITNDDSATISIDDVTMDEGDAGITTFAFTVILDGEVDTAVSVDYATQDGSATTADNDYSGAANTLNFAADTAAPQTLQIIVDVQGDEKVELTENFFVNLFNLQAGGRAVTIADNQGEGTITNDDQAVISIDDPVLLEGDSGLTLLQFTVNLDAEVDSIVTVDYQSADGTTSPATSADGDYFATNGTLLFNANTGGAQNRTITVNVQGDEKVELDEQMHMILSNLQANGRDVVFESGTTTETGTATILNDDSATVSIDDISMLEGDSGTKDFVFTVTLSSPVETAVTMDFQTVDDSAEDESGNGDYESNSDSLTFDANGGPGPQTRQITVTVNGDLNVENDEEFFVELFNLNASGRDVTFESGLATERGVGTILNDDQANITIDDVTMNEGDSGVTIFSFTVTLDTEVSSIVAVNYATQDDSAEDENGDGDYQSEVGQLVFAANTGGPQTRTINVAVNGDNKVEIDERFFVNLVSLQSTLTTVTISDNQGEGNILNDDQAALSINDVTQNEGNIGSRLFTFTVSLNGQVDQPVSVNFATQDGTATAAGGDYQSKAGILNFSGNAGETRQIVVLVDGDNIPEPTEFFLVNLANIQSGNRPVTLGDSQGVGTIVNDDSIYVTGTDAGGGPHVRVYNDNNQLIRDFFAYDAGFRGGVRVATGDVNGDGLVDIITAAGPSGGPHVKVYDGATGTLIRSFMAYGFTFTGGVHVSAGDINNDGFDDIITGAGPTGGPHVKVFDAHTTGEIRNFMAFDPAFPGGVTVAGGDVNGDGIDDIITGAGPGGGPHVKAFSGANNDLLQSFLAFDASIRTGINVAAGRVNNNATAEILVTVNGSAAVRGFENTILQFEFPAYGNVLVSPVVLSDADLTGFGTARVHVRDFNMDGVAEILTATGPGRPPELRFFSGQTFALLDSFFAYDPDFQNGFFVG